MERIASSKALAGTFLCLAAAAGIGTLSAYAQARHYVVRKRTVLLPPRTTEREKRDGDARALGLEATHSLRIVHFSDFHALARNKKLLRFVSSLRATEPDLIVLTGDCVAEEAGIDPVLQALASFQGIPGIFVYGSNDYYRPVPRNPLAYLVRNSNERKKMSDEEKDRLRLPTERLTAGLSTLGFVDLSNTRTSFTVNGVRIEAVGVDDPHIRRDRYPEPDMFAVDEHASSDDTAEHVLRLGVTHAPYTRVLNRMTADGCGVILAGHTHGGQVCLPGHRALVTNCDLPPRLASGLFEWPLTGDEPMKRDGDFVVKRGAAVQISAGLGTTPFVPLRTWCAPEAVLIDVVFA